MAHVERYHRRSIRLQGYDYTRDGAYFVTICTRGRTRVFGSVVQGEMRLNRYGREVANCWTWLAERYPYVHLDRWVVMPNHIHGIIVIADDVCADDTRLDDIRRGGSRTAPTTRTTPTGYVDHPIARTKRKPLGRLIGAFKTVSTKRVNDFRSTPDAKLWQRNYYEHVVRDDRALQRIREYIANNPSYWSVGGRGRAFIHVMLRALS
jgi:putative transposase